MNIESLNSYKMAQSQFAYGVKVAKKALDLQKQQGADVMKLIQSAKMIQQPKNNIDLYA